jgi:hypothetical protein
MPALGYICSHRGVWRATGWEIVQHFLAQQPTGFMTGPDRFGEVCVTEDAGASWSKIV